MSKKVSSLVGKEAYVILSFIFLLFCFLMASHAGDDVTYLSRLNSLGYITASIEHYQTWSSRIIIEIFVMFFSKYFFFWKILNAGVMTGTVWLLCRYALQTITGKNLIITFSLYCLVPLTLMREAGNVAITLNYHWAVFFTLVAFYQKLNGKKVTLLCFMVSVLRLIYAANQEQVNLCFLVFTCIVSIYLIKQRSYELKLSILSITSVIQIILFLMSLGNKARSLTEMKVRFSDFENFSIVNKIDLGISSFGQPFF